MPWLPGVLAVNFVSRQSARAKVQSKTLCGARPLWDNTPLFFAQQGGIRVTCDRGARRKSPRFKPDPP